MNPRWIPLIILSLGCSAEPLGDPVPDPPTEPPTEEPTPEEVPWPDTLSKTGLFAEFAAETLAAGVIPYAVAWPLWSDGTAKERFLWLPEGAVIDTSEPNLWGYPVGTKAWKHFALDGIRIETRFLERAADSWVRIAYQWRDDGSDADAVPDGVLDASGTLHDIPSTYQCATCHISEGLLGVGAIQLGADSPTATLNELWAGGSLSDPIEGSTAVPGEGATRQTLGYLHGNCGGCHVEHYDLSDQYPLRLRLLVGTEAPEDSQLYLTAIDTPTVHTETTTIAVVPGEPEASQLYERMGVRSLLQMPPLGTEVVDVEAHGAVHDWIMSLPATGR
jgi:hypothetical protein